MEQAIQLVAELLTRLKIDRGHGLDHALLVVKHARRALEYETLSDSDRLAVLLAALLHDVDDEKFVKSGELENAKQICDQVAPELTDLVLRMISLVSCSKNGNSLVEPAWLLIPRWADRLEANGTIGIFRCWVYTLYVGRPIMATSTELPKSLEDLERLAPRSRFEQYTRNRKAKHDSNSFIDHFYDKVLHLGEIPSENPYLLRKSKSRHQKIVDFLINFDPITLANLRPIIDKYQPSKL